MAGDAAGPGGQVDAPWMDMLEGLCDLLGGARGADVVALDATLRLHEAAGAARRLARACAELERRRGLLLDLRREATGPSGGATFVVRIRRRAARVAGPAG